MFSPHKGQAKRDLCLLGIAPTAALAEDTREGCLGRHDQMLMYCRGTAPAEGAPLMPGAQSRSAAGLASAQAGGRGRRARSKAARSNATGAEHCLRIPGALMKLCNSQGWPCTQAPFSILTPCCACHSTI